MPRTGSTSSTATSTTPGKKYHHCHGWKKLYCKAKWGIEIGGLKASVKVADGVLDAVRSAIKHFPVDLDPRVAILLGARDLATAALDVAKEAIKGLEDLEGFLKKALDALADALGKTLGHSINIKEAAFEATCVASSNTTTRSI